MDLSTLAGYASSAGDIASGVGAVANLFGQGDGASAMDLARTQLHTSLIGMKHAPYATVVGLRRAGLNPMLAIGKATPSPSIGMPNPIDDRQVSTAKAMAAASIANQAAQAKLYSAQAANVEADTQDKLRQPDYTSAKTAETQSRIPMNENSATLMGFQSGRELSQTNLNAALEKAANATTKATLVRAALDGVQLRVNQLYLEPTAKAELDQKLADLRTKLGQAAEGDYNAKFWESEIGQIMETAKRATAIAKPGGDRISNTTVNNRISQPKGR